MALKQCTHFFSFPPHKRIMLLFYPLKVLYSCWLVSFYKYFISSVLISGSNSVMAADVLVDRFLLKVLCTNKFTNRSVSVGVVELIILKKYYEELILSFNLFFSFLVTCKIWIKNIIAWPWSKIIAWLVYQRCSWGLEKSLDHRENIEKSPCLADNVVLQPDAAPGCHRAGPLARWRWAAVIRNHQLC